MSLLARVLARVVRRRAEDLRWRALTTRVFARVDYADSRSVAASREEAAARLLDIRVRGADALTEWLEGR